MYIRLFYKEKLESVVEKEWNKKKRQITSAKAITLTSGTELDAMMDPSQINRLWIAHLNEVGRRMYTTETDDVKDIVKREIDLVTAQKVAMENQFAGDQTDPERLRHLQR